MKTCGLWISSLEVTDLNLEHFSSMRCRAKAANISGTGGAYIFLKTFFPFGRWL